MTTIAYKDGLIAVDSLATAGNRIVDDDFIKVVINDYGFFAFSGTPADIDSFIIEAMNGKEGSYDWECSAFWVDSKETLYNIEQCDKGMYYVFELNKDRSYSIGSGSSYALSAMDMGATAREAVEAAARRDTCTGGTIRVYDIKTGEEVEG